MVKVEQEEPVTDKCPVCGRRGLTVRTDEDGDVHHEHTTRGNVLLAMPGGCGYVAVWRKSQFKRQMKVVVPTPLGFKEEWADV